MTLAGAIVAVRKAAALVNTAVDVSPILIHNAWIVPESPTTPVTFLRESLQIRIIAAGFAIRATTSLVTIASNALNLAAPLAFSARSV